jgi:hypothetical protein
LAVIVVSFLHVGRRLAVDARLGQPSFVPWGVGASLFTLVVTSVSVSYFDQSLLWLYMTIAFCCVLNNERPPVPVGARTAGPVTAASHRARRRNRTQPERELAVSGARLSETRISGG